MSRIPSRERSSAAERAAYGEPAAAHTSRINLATGIAQMSARSPVTMAMHTMTLDALSDGRFRHRIGVSGPQVVEGWYGRPFGQPLARTREYSDSAALTAGLIEEGHAVRVARVQAMHEGKRRARTSRAPASG